jgi:hypothetical protein
MEKTDEILDLVAKSQITEALKLLKLSPKFKKDKGFQTQLILIEKQHRSSEDQFSTGQVDSDAHERKRNLIANSVIKLAQTFQADGKADAKMQQEALSYQPGEANNHANLGSLLFIASNPKGIAKIPFEREFINIHTAFQNQYPTVRLKFREDVTAANFARVIRKEQPRYLHFCGYCDEGLEGFHDAGIVLKDKDNNPYVRDFDTAAGAIKLAVKNAPLHLAIFSSGFSDSIAKAVSTLGCYAVGFVGDLLDSTITTFVENFYHALSENLDDIEYAFACSINEVFGDDKKKIKLYKDGELVAQY